ncbi:Bcpax1 [Botrytis cinerea B05.10]|uniref:Bcpax1 n=2 Tax=Botryotinia fuckeliana TaxID=40559 RepID=A0A384JHZ4_BOTFB|nr:Bcpax1 [Botrytis cinerea B05.10]ATZ50193.1 Bcpax1 [Botrytis cinerea B05.10]CCD53534.1 BcPAX1, similar to paxillin biosynthesis enzyme PAXC [Botrytis cinerea T4]
MFFDWMKQPQWWSTSSSPDLRSISNEAVPNGILCPYEYILDVYGPGHFTKILQILDPGLENNDPKWYQLILEIMDAIHFGAILVDDVADNSHLRKGRIAAHRIYGTAETINRAYLRIFEVIEKCRSAKPSAIPAILDNLTQIHKGQDESLVWRRDGFDKGLDRAAALTRYRECASLKTGALFRLIGQLATGSHEKDQLMSDFGWYCQLQNDCKNVFSSDVVAAKGALAEDLANGEYSFPILVALYSSPRIKTAVEKALSARQGGEFKEHVHNAAMILQEDEVRGLCLGELAILRENNSIFASVWGRKEGMLVSQSVPVAEKVGKSKTGYFGFAKRIFV